MKERDKAEQCEVSCMAENKAYRKAKQMLVACKEFCKKETVFVVAIVLAVISAFLVPPSKAYIAYIDFRVLALLFCLMLIVAGVKEQGIFRRLGECLITKVKDVRHLELVLSGLCFFSGMLITNDVALITFVPFALEILISAGLEKKIVKVVVMQTIAANLGSMLTPIGNPQNLYLYSLTGMGLMEFIVFMLPLTLLSLVLLVVVILAGKGGAIEAKAQKSRQAVEKKKLLLYAVLFIVCMGTVIRVIPWQVSLLTVCASGLIAFRNLFAKADYCLLGTFLGFFIFVGNMQNVPAVSNLLQKLLKGKELIVSVVASQVISNVPAAMLLSGFTEDYKSLIYGVDIGGLGTLIASLASLISYKYFCAVPGGNKGKYLKEFTLWNLLFLAVLLPVAFLLI